MRIVATLCVALSAGLLATSAWARGPDRGPSFGGPLDLGEPTRTPPGLVDPVVLRQDPAAELTPMPEASVPMAMPAEAGVIELFPCVTYKNECKIAPCAEPMIVSIKDPCICKPLCCTGCPPVRCVHVKICVPPCDCPNVKIKREGAKIRYDFGKYSVTIRSVPRKGEVIVDYGA